MKFLMTLCIGMLFFACTNDDDASNSVVANVPQDVIAISTNTNSVFRTDITGTAANLNSQNLTDDLGVPTDYSNFSAAQEILGFNKRGNNIYDFWEIDLQTEATYSVSDLCNLEPFEGVLAASNTRDKLLQFSRLSIGVELNNFIYIYDKTTTECTKTFLGVGGLSPSNSFYLGDDYALVYLDAATVPIELSRVSLETGLITHQITFVQEARVTVANGIIHAFFIDDSYKTYSAATLEQLSSGEFDFSITSVQTGFFKAQIQDQLMLVDLPYPQPSLFNTGPALINLENNQLVAGEDYFLFDLRIGLTEELGRNVDGFTNYTLNLSTGLIAIGYGLGDGSGGVVYTNFEAEIIKVVPLETVPKELVFI